MTGMRIYICAGACYTGYPEGEMKRMQQLLLFDGAFGTYYESLTNIGARAPYPELANLQDPDRVLRIHRAYIAAGAGAVKTNTYGVNSRLTEDPALRRKILEKGYALAAQAAGEKGVQVFADIGPAPEENAAAEYRELAETFLELGGERFLFETLGDAAPCREAFSRIKARNPRALVIASFAVTQDGYTRSGRYYRDLFEEAAALGADMVGLNCMCGPAHMLELIRKVEPGRYRLSVMPNAGYPANVNGRCVYVDNPAYFADKLRQLADCGVAALGGCCGTTPEHIAAAAAALKREGGPVPPVRPAAREIRREQGREETPSRKVIAVEITPPADTDADFVLRASREMKEADADFITIPDSPMAKTRSSSLMIAALIQREIGISAIPHLCCRDRNQIAMKGDLVAGSIWGLRHILAITGDPVPAEDRSAAKSVFGMNSWQLIRFIASLNREIFPEFPYRLYGALNINAGNFEQELKRAERKIENGAVGLFTQPLFSPKSVERLREACRALPCRVMAGILPVAGYRNAVFLNNELPGIEIPDEVVETLRDKGPEETMEISLAYCRNLIDAVLPACGGFYVMTPLKRTAYSREIVRYIREKEAEEKEK